MSKVENNRDRFSNLINKLPFTMGAAASIIAGIISYNQFGGTQGTYLRMAVGMAVFYVLGVYIRSSLNMISDEMQEKKRMEEERLEAELAMNEAQSNAEKGNAVPPRLDIKVDDSSEFQPLTVRQVIRNNLSEQDK